MGRTTEPDPVFAKSWEKSFYTETSEPFFCNIHWKKYSMYVCMFSKNNWLFDHFFIYCKQSIRGFNIIQSDPAFSQELDPDPVNLGPDPRGRVQPCSSGQLKC